MGFSKKDAQQIYEVISKSPEIQELIRNIAKNGGESFSNKEIDISAYRSLNLQFSNLQMQLRDVNEEKENYKRLYDEAQTKLFRCDDLEREIGLLKTKESQLISNLRKKELEIEALNEEIKNFQSDIATLSTELDDAMVKIGEVKKFEVPVKYFELYRNLSNKVRSGLENVVSDTNEITFIASCTEENNLSAIWEYIRDLSGDSENEDFLNLNKIFDYFFEIFNQSLPESKYERDNVEIGEEFDEDYHDRYYGSSTSGKITQVILKGYRLKNTGRIVQKSLVRV